MRAFLITTTLAMLASANLATAARAEPGCAPSDVAAVALKGPLIKANDDAIQLAKQYFRLATDQRDMFEERKYAIDIARNGEVWTASIFFMKRPRLPWDDWKRRGKVGKVVMCGYDGKLLGWEATY